LYELWKKMAHEEQNHASIISMVIRCRGTELGKRDCDLKKFRTSAQQVRNLFDRLKAVRPSAEDALRSAINPEKRLIGFPPANAVSFVDRAREGFSRTNSREASTTSPRSRQLARFCWPEKHRPD